MSDQCGYTGIGIVAEITYPNGNGGTPWVIGSCRSVGEFTTDTPDIERPQLLKHAGWQQQYCPPHRALHDRIEFELELYFPDDVEPSPSHAGFLTLHDNVGVYGTLMITWPSLDGVMPSYSLSGPGWLASVGHGEVNLANDEVQSAVCSWRFQGGNPADAAGTRYVYEEVSGGTSTENPTFSMGRSR